MPVNTPVMLRLGTRTSRLARWQTDYVAGLFRAAWPQVVCEVIPFMTHGDRVLDRPLPEFGGKGVFTQELEHALTTGEIDLAVHSLKDLPVADTPGLAIGAICARADAHDVLISREGVALDQLPTGARVGTSSVRRSAQLLAIRPDLTLLPLRGNVDTRVEKALRGEYDAVVLAEAGVSRLGLERFISQRLAFEIMLPAPGQGAVAVQCRAGDAATRALLRAIHDPATNASVMAERAFLTALGGGCSAPIAAYAECAPQGGDARITLSGLIASVDGRCVIRVRGAGGDPTTCGAELARQAMEQGAQALLAGVPHV
jgi:hydroxymethylbilane synthase